MTLSKFLLAIASIAVFSLAGCARHDGPASASKEPKRIASVDVVKVIVPPVEIAAGNSADTTIRLEIQSGYHVNANPPTFSYLIPTQLTITPSAGVSAGTVSYPAAKTATFSFSEKPLAVYEGNVEIKATLKTEKSAQPGQHSLAAKLQVQACDDQVCYAPGERELTIPVTIKQESRAR